MPSPYEQNAIKEIDAWRRPETGWFGKAMRIANWPLDKAGEIVMKTPGVGWTIQNSVGGLVNITNELAQSSVRTDAILGEYREQGHHVQSVEDIARLDLEEVDRTIGWLAVKYKGLALTEGAALGAMGLPGIPLDILALVSLNMRCIGEYATYCGFRVASQRERLYAMHLLGFASSPNDGAKGLAMAELVKIAKDVATKKAWKDLEKHAFVKLMQQIAKALGIRLTKAKLAEIVPYAGAAVGGGFNVYFTSKVCDAAYFLYRERFLASKYGAQYMRGATRGGTPPEASA